MPRSRTARRYPAWMGKMRALTKKEIKEFLAGPVVARLATIKPDGSPYVTPVWQHYNGRELFFIPRERSAFVRYLKANPRICISCALDSGFHTRVIFEGKAEILEGPTPMKGRTLRMARSMAKRYLGKRGPDYLENTLDRPRYLVRLVPEKITSWEGVEWAARYLE